MKLKKFVFAATLLCAVAVQLASCSDDETVMSYPVAVNVTLPQEITDGGGTVLDEEYGFKNVSTNQLKTFAAKEDILLIPGLYDVTYTAHVQMPNGVVSTMRALAQSVQIKDGNNSVALTAYNTIESDDLIIVEVFNTGTTTSTGAQYRGDSYLKLYNNTDHVVYADGLSFFESDFSTMQKYEYDPDIMSEAVIVRTLYTVPGDGTKFPVQPGGYFLIADRANNHRLTNSLSFDLTGADVEWYDESKVASQQDTDNPDVPNMDKIYSYSNSITILDQAQRAFGIARISNPGTFTTDNVYTATYKLVTAAGSFDMTKNGYKLPNKEVVDVVTFAPRDNYQWNVTSPALDCGWTWVAANNTDKTRFFHSARRKMLYLNEAGNPVFKDTNNSTADFNAYVVPSEIEIQGTAINADGDLSTVRTYDGVVKMQ